MTDALTFLSEAKANGFDFFTGVPCSFLTPLINATIEDSNSTYVAAASEGESVAIASGAWLAGSKTAVMFQNSGLGNAINPLTSLNYPFRIPTLIICTWRAGPGLKDEPQHELMGVITPELFDTMRIPHMPFPKTNDAVGDSLTSVSELMEKSGLPVSLIMEKGDVDSYELTGSTVSSRVINGQVMERRIGKAHVTRYAALEELLKGLSDDTAVIATTGKCGRELFQISDRPQHLYQVGSMGCAAGMGLGVALNAPNPVVVIDGDGALMMKMGTLATIGAYAPPNLIHVVLDNGTYDSTGGQPTVSPHVDFASAAIASGYACGFRCDDLAGFDDALAEAKAAKGPSLIHMKILPGSLKDLGRPTISPAEVAQRFRVFLAAEIPAGARR
jgi:phosphonopyruvate decarboxylase